LFFDCSPPAKNQLYPARSLSTGPYHSAPHANSNVTAEQRWSAAPGVVPRTESLNSSVEFALPDAHTYIHHGERRTADRRHGTCSRPYASERANGRTGERANGRTGERDVPIPFLSIRPNSRPLSSLPFSFLLGRGQPSQALDLQIQFPVPDQKVERGGHVVVGNLYRHVGIELDRRADAQTRFSLDSHSILTRFSLDSHSRYPALCSFARCAICRNNLYEASIDYQANPNGDPEHPGLSIAWGQCGHVFHLDCIQRWLKTRSACPLCQKEWDFTKIEKINPSSN